MENKKLKSLYEILPAIDCPLCGDTSRISVHIDGISDYEGANMDTNNLNIGILKSGFVLYNYTINIHTGYVTVQCYDRKEKREIKGHRIDLLSPIKSFKLKAGYCTRTTRIEGRPLFYAHYVEEYQCEIDLSIAKINSIENIGFMISDVKDQTFIKLQTNSTSTEIRVGQCGQPATTSLKVKSLPLAKCVEMLQSNKYFNLL